MSLESFLKEEKTHDETAENSKTLDEKTAAFKRKDQEYHLNKEFIIIDYSLDLFYMLCGNLLPTKVMKPFLNCFVTGKLSILHETEIL